MQLPASFSPNLNPWLSRLEVGGGGGHFRNSYLPGTELFKSINDFCLPGFICAYPGQRQINRAALLEPVECLNSAHISQDVHNFAEGCLAQRQARYFPNYHGGWRGRGAG